MLKGKSAIVTGSTSGIGLGIARCLAAQGADVLLNGFGDRGEIAALCESLGREFGVRVAYDGADMSKPAEIKAMVANAEQAFGKVDILVNNAGIQHVAPVEDFPEDAWERVISINLSAVFYGTRYALPGMKARNWGRIINIASAHGLVASANKSAYVAAKHGVVGLTKTVALETALTNVTCNAICPGWVLTPLVQKQIDALAEKNGWSNEQAGRELLREKQPSETFVTPEQLGELAVFLSSEAASNMRGAAINMDGGWLAR
ncbi:3-hydroxybutyrate dehydrogenase [Azospirillum rugosum]|uniref:3-hydroxybutyrate dehydrogenase n=1 Tax=Azospirillum rugosum TaxID=416170 RepID=A0ABS4SLT1_9PROT|nr:3-hydroxybutyrate dehydrogenase [Azospirillum rugosum]MBP2292897.1 3-hydroxybutyrate dehydrogenase [Azospirillum rugosum]MDQ0529351.1 3-hydroxybutyrate dehydrogenase [Azospirillum rugosum]